MAAHVRQHRPGMVWHCPALPPSPADAMALAMAAVGDWPRHSMAVVGSSLGGFYARCLAQRLGCRAVLLNPAAEPARDLAQHIGEHSAWHQPAQRFYFSPAYVAELLVLQDELRSADPALAQAKPGDPLAAPLLALLAKGDEVLDWREMLAFACAHSGPVELRLLPTSDHGLSDFEAHLALVWAFLLRPRP